ncbi:MAG: hypothetical protein JOZ25_00510 [Actinobacteria bacterium]|nr:hypothetical protein [Actinomycetota bacterium]
MSAASRRKPRALIGFAEAVAAPETAFSLLDAGFDVVAFARSRRTAALSRCKAVRLVDVPSPARDRLGTVTAVTSLVDEVEPDVLLPLDDAALWACDSGGDRVRGLVCGPAGAQVELALDKRVQLEAAAAAGFEVVPTRALRSIDEVIRDEPPDFPVLIKGALALFERGDGLGTAPVSICGDAGELTAAGNLYEQDEPLLLQPFVHGRVEGLFGLALDGEVQRASAHTRLRGVGAKGSTSACAPLPVDPALLEAAARMLRAARWNGLYMFEMLRARDGRALFLELNGRAWGSMALARRMGFEYPAWAAIQKIEPTFTPPEPPPRDAVTCRHLGREVLHLLWLLRGADSAALSDLQSRRRGLREVLRVGRADRWYNLRRGSGRLFLYDSVNTVRSGLRSRVRAR